MPEISVLMSVYNGAEYIADSIESILNQTYSDFELLIINDGSTDNTENVIRGFKDQRIKLYNLNENLGIGAALQFGLSKVQGKYIAKADADDLNHPERLMKQKEFLDNHPDVILVKSLIKYFPDNDNITRSQNYFHKKNVLEKEKNSIITPEEIREKMYWFCCISHATIMAHSDIIKAFGYRDFRICEDYDLFYRLNQKGFKMATIEETLVNVRVTDNSTTATTNSIDFAKMVYKIKKDEISHLFNDSKEVFIWGSGSLGRNVLEILEAENLEISGFIDNDLNKQGCSLNGKIVYSPEVLNKGKGNFKVIVASQPGKYEIVKSLKEWNYRHLEDFLVFY